MLGITSVRRASISPDGSTMTVEVNVKVKSTGWTLEEKVDHNRQGEVVKVTLTPSGPSGKAGMGFPPDGQNFTVTIDGPFAAEVEVIADGSSLKVSC